MANVLGRQVVLPLLNSSGGGVIAGDVVIFNSAADNSFTTTTSAGYNGGVGIAQETIASSATGRVLVFGYAPLVNVNASVTRGNYGTTHTVAKQATDAGASRTTGTFCRFTTGGTTPSAWIWFTDLQASAASAEYPWHINVIPMIMTPDASTGTWAINGNSGSGLVFPWYTPGSTANSGAAGIWDNSTAVAQNDACAWDIVLAAGTWDAHFWVLKAASNAIITLNQEGASQGTVDTYAAANAAAKVSITGWTVSATGKKRMEVKAATKNASSSNYNIRLFAIEFRRTA